MMETSAHAAKRQEHIAVDPGQPLSLSIQNPSGNIAVGVADRPDLLVSYDAPPIGGGFGADGNGLIIEAHGNRVEVRAESAVGGSWGNVAAEFDLEAVLGHISKAFNWGGHGPSGRAERGRTFSGRQGWIDINIEIPRALSTQLQISSAAGDVRVHDVTGEITLNTMSGDAQVRGSRGDLVIRTANGDLVLDDASGHLTVNTASGAVRISASTLDGAQIQTANGDILLDQVALGERPLQIQTANGDVRLALQRVAASGMEPAATLTFQTIAGDTHVDPAFRKMGRRLWQAGAGPGPRIDVKTVSGDLVASIVPIVAPAHPLPPPPAFLPEPPAPPQPPAPAAPLAAAMPLAVAAMPPVAALEPEAPSSEPDAAARLAVLEAVERGEIDIEEALRRLEASDSASQP